MSFLSPLPSPHLKCLHIQHFGLDRVTRTPCLTRCSLCLCYLLLPRRMGSPPPLRFLLCSDQDVPGRIWVMRLVQRVPRWDPPSPSLQLLSAWFKLEGQRLEEGKMVIEQNKNISVNISPNVIPSHLFSQKQHFRIPFKSFFTGSSFLICQ